MFKYNHNSIQLLWSNVTFCRYFMKHTKAGNTIKRNLILQILMENLKWCHFCETEDQVFLKNFWILARVRAGTTATRWTWCRATFRTTSNWRWCVLTSRWRTRTWSRTITTIRWITTITRWRRTSTTARSAWLQNNSFQRILIDKTLTDREREYLGDLERLLGDRDL